MAERSRSRAVEEQFDAIKIEAVVLLYLSEQQAEHELWR